MIVRFLKFYSTYGRKIQKVLGKYPNFVFIDTMVDPAKKYLLFDRVLIFLTIYDARRNGSWKKKFIKKLHEIYKVYVQQYN